MDKGTGTHRDSIQDRSNATRALNRVDARSSDSSAPASSPGQCPHPLHAANVSLLARWAAGSFMSSFVPSMRPALGCGMDGRCGPMVSGFASSGVPLGGQGDPLGPVHRPPRASEAVAPSEAKRRRTSDATSRSATRRAMWGSMPVAPLINRIARKSKLQGRQGGPKSRSS